MRLQLPLDKKLRVKGAIVCGVLGEGDGRGGGEPAVYTLVAQGAGSFFKNANASNGAIVDMLEGATTTGVLLRHFEWKGSVRIWWHGERTMAPAEVERLEGALRDAPTDEHRRRVLRDAYSGVRVTQASAMEDPYQRHVPESISALRAQGYRVMMVTGDSESAAENIAYAVGLAVRGAPAVHGEGVDGGRGVDGGGGVEGGVDAHGGVDAGHHVDVVRPLVRIGAETPRELLDAAHSLLPAARMGEFCFLLGARAATVLQESCESVREAESEEVFFFSHSTHFSHMSEPSLPISHL